MLILVASSTLLSGCASGKLKQAETQIIELQGRVTDLEHQLGVARGDTDEARAQAAELERQLSDLSEREKLNLEKIDQLTVVRLPEQVLFKSGSANITSSGKTVLDELADVLEDFPEYDVRVEGHTDAKSIKPEFQDKFYSNWELSTLRATTVLRHLIANHDLTPERLSAVGYGEYHPVSSNETPEGRAMNRRVEFHIKRADRGATFETEPREMPVP